MERILELIVWTPLEQEELLEWGPHYQFKDTLQFLPGSLEKLGESLKAGGDQEFVYLNDMADRMDYNEEQRTLLKEKGIFPYDWFDSSDKLQETSLPERKAFDSVAERGLL